VVLNVTATNPTAPVRTVTSWTDAAVLSAIAKGRQGGVS